MQRNNKMIALFSGAGGMDLGFKNKGFDILWACDFNKDAVETYKYNIGEHIELADITKVDSNEIPGKPYELDVIIGGFPCQGFSIANKNRSMEDERNFLYLEMLRIINDKKPKFFVAENVKGLVSMQNGAVIEMIIEDFKKIGYKVDYKILNTANYGVPQARERVIIIGNRLGIKNVFPKPTHQPPNTNISLFEPEKPSHITVEDAIGFLSDIEIQNGKTDEYILVDGKKIYNHIASTSVHDKFFGRKYKVDQAEVCDYLKYWRDKSEWTTKKIDEHFGYKHTAG
ncbi:DNA cytosine methyltransferase, partial [Kurthia gibsonii]|uniref:DNA cytosine methyltransferase n=1 Tax=Kurthia gibsonii TaxID=33946 RepID=UPI0020FFF9FE